MSIGIYKITSPNNKVYIGQATNIEKRWKFYKRITCSDQPRLYNSLLKYGWEQHIFEIIEECNLEQLDKREIFYKQQSINNLGWENVLFCHLIDGKGGYKSEETKRKISQANKGKKHSIESCLKKSISLKGRIESEETKKLKSKNNMGVSRGKGIPKSKEHVLKLSKSLRKPVLQYDLNGNFIKEWEGLREAKIWITKEKSIYSPNVDKQIKDCCNGRQKTCHGYKFKYK